MIDKDAWHGYLGDKGSPSKQFNKLMQAMLDEKALLYLSLDGLSFAGHKEICLPAVHKGLQKVVTAGRAVTQNYFWIFKTKWSLLIFSSRRHSELSIFAHILQKIPGKPEEKNLHH
jgi:hypothetical protein